MSRKNFMLSWVEFSNLGAWFCTSYNALSWWLFCQTVLKFHHEGQTYRSDKNICRYSLCTKFTLPWHSSKRNVFCMRNITLFRWSCMPNNFQIPPCRTKLWVEHEFVTHKPLNKVYVHSDPTFNLATWFLIEINRLVIIICSKLF